MILYVQPITNVHAVAVDRKRLIVQRVGDHKRNQFLRKLVRAVIVRTSSNNDRGAEGMKVGKGQQIGGSFARRIGAVRMQRGRFGKPSCRTQRTVDFVGRDMDESFDSKLP